MFRWNGIRYITAGLVLFLFASGFLGFCVGPNYKPCSIQFTAPVNGTVFPTGTSSVTIQGIIIAGDKQPVTLKANGAAIPFDKTSGTFAYVFPLASSSIYSTCTFQVSDANGIVNRERISFAVGESAEPGADSVVDNAARLLLSDGFMDQVEIIGAEFINNWKNDLIYGYTHPVYGSANPQSPFAGAAPLLPLQLNDVPVGDYIRIDNTMSGDHKGYINLGNISMAIDILPNSEIRADLNIAPESWVNPRGGSAKALFVQGHHEYWWLGNPHFTLIAGGASITNARLKLSVDADNMIVAHLDLSGAALNLNNVTTEYGILEFPDFISQWIIDLVKDEILSTLALNIPIVDVNSIAFDLSGVKVGGWPMDPVHLFSSTATDMTIDLGLSAELDDGVVPLVPGLTRFYSTPGDSLPALSVTGDENVILALNDDLVNNAAFVAIQAGLVKDIDISDQFKTELGKLANYKMKAIANLTTPPICDFSASSQGGSSDTLDAGRIIVKDLRIDLYNASLIPPYPHAARCSVDADIALKLNISDDGKHIQASIDTEKSVISSMTLYSNLTSAALLPNIGGKIANDVLNKLIGKMISIQINSLDLFGSQIGISIEGGGLQNNCLIAKIRIENM